MRQILLSLLFICHITANYAQKNEIYHFQKAHPKVSFISQERFNSFSHEEILLLGNDYILFNKEISVSDLASFKGGPRNKELRAESAKDIDTAAAEEVLNEIKIWLATHPSVKIVKNSEFEALSEPDKIHYINNQCLILIGETITSQDLANYPF